MEKVKIYEERIRVMEQMVGMIADNPIYTNDHVIDSKDSLYEGSRNEELRTSQIKNGV